MLKEQRLSFFSEEVMFEKNRDDQIESLLYEAENDLFDLNNGFILESEGNVVTSIWTKLKKIIASIIDKISSIFKKKVVEEVDLEEEVEVEEKEISGIKKFLANVKKILSMSFKALGEALTGHESTVRRTLFLAEFTVGTICVYRDRKNHEIRLRNSYRMKKKEALDLIKTSEDELKDTNNWISKSEDFLKTIKNPAVAITPTQKKNRNRYEMMKKNVSDSKDKAAKLNDNSSMANYAKNLYDKKLHESGSTSDNYEECMSFSKACSSLLHKIIENINKIISALSNVVFTNKMKRNAKYANEQLAKSEASPNKK